MASGSSTSQDAFIFEKLRGMKGPQLKLAEFGMSILVDIFILPHNALRQQLSSLQLLLFAFGDRIDSSLKLDEINAIRTWWGLVLNTYKAKFQAEDQVIFPELEKKGRGPLGGEGAQKFSREKSVMEDKKQVILRSVTDILRTFAMINERQRIVDFLVNIIDAANVLLSNSVEYFLHEEKKLPNILADCFPLPVEQEHLEREVIAVYRTSDAWKDMLVMFTLAMHPDQEKAWRKQKTTFVDKVQFPMWKHSYEAKILNPIADILNVKQMNDFEI